MSVLSNKPCTRDRQQPEHADGTDGRELGGGDDDW
jgi:hypothetical protein